MRAWRGEGRFRELLAAGRPQDLADVRLLEAAFFDAHLKCFESVIDCSKWEI